MMTPPKRCQTVLQRSHFAALVLVVALPLMASCAHQRHEIASTQTVSSVRQEIRPAPTVIDVSIVNLHDEVAPDPATEKVVGTIVNDGDKPVSRIPVRVNAIDASGQVVHTVTTPPLAQPIDPFGGRATFEAIMPRDRAVAGYHAVAVAQ